MATGTTVTRPTTPAPDRKKQLAPLYRPPREPVFVDGPVATERIGYRFFLQPPTVSATVTAIDGINDFSDHAEVDTVSVHLGPGAALLALAGPLEYVQPSAATGGPGQEGGMGRVVEAS